MSWLRFIFLPEIAKTFAEASRATRRLAALAAAVRPPPRSRPLDFRRLLDRRMRARAIIGAVLILAGIMLAIAAAPVSAQTAIDPSLFQSEDDETRAILSFVHRLVGETGSTVLGTMFLLFNAGILVLAGVLLLYHVVAGLLDTARQGRWGFGGWQIVRVVTAVALMAPLAGGLNGGQHIVLGLANLGGDFATEVWSPFTDDILEPTRSIVPNRGGAALRSTIARVLVAEVCMATANATSSATLVERTTVSEGFPERTTTRYAGIAGDVPPEACGAVTYEGYGLPGLNGFLVWPWESGADPPPVDYELAQLAAGEVPAAHYHALNTELAPAIRALAVELASHYVPGTPSYGTPLPPANATLSGSGIEERYTAIVGEALRSSQAHQDEAMADLADAYSEHTSWLWTASFFHVLAWQTGRFETASAATPEVRLPNDRVAAWSAPAAAATTGILTWLTASSFSPVPAAATAALEQGTVSHRPLSIITSLIHVIPIDWTVMASPDNPILSLASLGFWLITGSLASISSLAGVAVLNNTTRAVPLIGDALDVFAAAWPVLDGFVTLMLTTMLIAGLVLAYLLPAIPFIRFLFGILTWLITVIEALLAITIFLAAHVTREDADRLLTSSTRLGWLFLPGLVLRPVLMVFGLVLGYFAFKAIISLLNAVWVPLMQTSHAQAAASPLGFLAMLAIYTIIAYGAANAAFKLIDLLPGHILTWIGGAAGIDAGGTEGVGTVAAGAASRTGTAATPGFMGRTPNRGRPPFPPISPR